LNKVHRIDPWPRSYGRYQGLSIVAFGCVDAILIVLAIVRPDPFLSILFWYGLGSGYLGTLGSRLFFGWFADDEDPYQLELLAACGLVWQLMAIPCLIAAWLINEW
jgi:hypothetical protein